MQAVHLAFLQVVIGAQLIHLDTRGGQRGFVGFRADLDAPLLDGQLFQELLRPRGRDFGVDLGNQPVARQSRVPVRLQLGGVVIRIDLRDFGLHVEKRGLQGHLDLGIVGLRRLDRVLGGQQLVVELRAAEDHHQRIRPHRRAGADQDALHARVRGGGDQHGIFGNQRAVAAHFANQRAALDGVRPQGREVHRRGRGFEPAHSVADAAHHQRQGGEDHGDADCLPPFRVRAWDVHSRLPDCWSGTAPAKSRVRSNL